MRTGMTLRSAAAPARVSVDGHVKPVVPGAPEQRVQPREVLRQRFAPAQREAAVRALVVLPVSGHDAQDVGNGPAMLLGRGRDGGLRFRVVAPLALQGAAPEEHGGADPRSVVDAGALDVQDRKPRLRGVRFGFGKQRVVEVHPGLQPSVIFMVNETDGLVNPELTRRVKSLGCVELRRSRGRLIQNTEENSPSD